jgi:hypothetical protein
MRGAPLRVALRELGAQPDTPVAASAVLVRSVPAPADSDFFVAPSGEDDDDEPPPRALRPEQLAHWLDRGD